MKFFAFSIYSIKILCKNFFNEMNLPQNLQEYVYMISSCPASYTKDQRDIKARCEGSSNPHTYHMDLPVETVR